MDAFTPLKLDWGPLRSNVAFEVELEASTSLGSSLVSKRTH